ncbi:hypothetical protein JOF48_001857 [Arthrobacter stackebrandtii]|uniref:Secreted protein n=1 Tax=Arthrobacter stackebrandtii TaxID=272161 RepID=A0ABS4YWA0_9MICC|nr:hypothetical protein [Arthrobacter stackebrandtii]MBP2413058.1 hypothetical protein [Arthrobacter stackebrandtii]PYH01169.1 hypothetical protein CVV67_06150 [Arthrobacter stackebrandtii]
MKISKATDMREPQRQAENPLPNPGKANPAGPKPAKPKRKGMAALAVLAGVVLFGAGFLTATATADPTASGEYLALDADQQRLISDKKALEKTIAGQGEQLVTLQGQIIGREDAVEQQAAEVKEKDEALAVREEAVKKREDAVAGAEAKQAANTIGDGMWVVGDDVEPGVYKAKSDVGSSCYWAILASGTNGDDIISNDLPGGGTPSVTLAAGQDFKSSRCGQWIRQ